MSQTTRTPGLTDTGRDLGAAEAGEYEKKDRAAYEQEQDHYNGPYDVPVLDDGKQVIPAGTLDPVYEAKCRVLNRAIQDIGMGWYQWQLFIVVGFGWASDNMWPIVTSLILPAVSQEFGVTAASRRRPLLTLAQNIGLLVGAMFWGFGADIFGRKMAFNLTLGITSVFGMIAASSPNWAAIGIFAEFWSFGVGGNLPVDSAVFLEFLPASHQYLLTVLSVDWAIAQVVANLVAWGLLGNFSCEAEVEVCTKSNNMGWRYFVITIGGLALIMFALRFFCFTIYESPKYLMGKGKDEEAVRVVHEVARRNKKPCNLTVDDLRACEPPGYVAQTDAATQVKRRLEAMKGEHIRALFSSRKLAFSTAMLMMIWALIGLGYPLYNAFLPEIQRQKEVEFDNSVSTTYRNSLIIAVLGVPGALIGAALSETTLGRRGVLGGATALTGVFLYVSTTAHTSNAFLGYNCAFSLFSSTMYAVLYCATPEAFPTVHRGTGNALTATANRVFGIMAPIVAMYADLRTSAPVYVSGALFLVAGAICFILPYESRGKASM